MSTSRSRDLRHYSSKQHIDGSHDHTPSSSHSSEVKKDKKGLFSRMFGSSSSSHSESAAEVNYRKKMTDATEEQQQQHPYYSGSSVGSNSSSANRDRARDRDGRDKDRDNRDKEKDKEKDRDREHRSERDRDKDRDRDKEKDRDGSSYARPPKDKDYHSKRDRERDRGDGSTSGSSKDRSTSRELSRDRERSKDRDRSSRDQHSQSFSHSGSSSERRYHTSSSSILPEAKKSSSHKHSSSTANLLSGTGIGGSDENKVKSGTTGTAGAAHENAYLSSLLSSASGPSGSSTANNGSTASTAVTKSSSGGGVSAGGSSSRHTSSGYEFGSSDIALSSSPMMMNMNLTPGSGITPSHQTLFLEMNRMFEVTGIKFDRSGITAGEAIAILGDQHLAKLEDMCKRILASISSDKERPSKGLPKDPDSVSNGQGHTEVALIYTEVLQLQGRPQEAVVVLSKAIEKLNHDLAEAKRQRSKKDSSSANDGSSIVSGSTRTASQSLEFDHLKKMKALCHRRIGSLYKLTNRLKDAEEHIKRYISIVERTSSADVDAVKRETSLAYSLLTAIYDAMGKTNEAQAADKVAIELAASLGRVD